MPAPFASLTSSDLAILLDRFPFKRRVTSVHMHHTWRPDQRQYRGHDTIVGMWRFHTQERGFVDIAQHLSIAPDGTLWTGRDWNLPPASASGHNGNAVSGPFMFEIIGDFDVGQDQMSPDQEAAVLDVIALVQKRFQLVPEALLFHNMLSAKSCPGTSIDRTDWLERVRKHASTRAPGARSKPSGPFQPRESMLNDAVNRALECLTAPLPAGSRAVEPENAELDYIDEPSARSRAIGGTERRADRLSPEEIDALRPHVINLRQGLFSGSGQMTTRLGDVEALFNEHLERWITGRDKARIVLFAHGGLVSESSGLAIAQKHVDWWRRNGVYPIYFVWETGLFETIGQLLERTRARSQATAPGERGVFSDWISNPIIEEAVRALQADRVWGGMKLSAQRASEAPLGGAHEVATRLAALTERHGNRVELHAVGHSAGSIFHSYFLPACHATGNVRFRSAQFLAPAATTKLFRENLIGLTGADQTIERITLYTMRRSFEEADNCAKIYRKSLLYLVSEACEPKRKTPILGLEESLRDNAELQKFFGLGHQHPTDNEIVWSKSPLDTGRSASRSTSHGGFDDDAPTLNSVLRRVLDLPDAANVEHPYPRERALPQERAWIDEVDWPAVLDEAPRFSAPAAPVAAPCSTMSATPAPSPAGQRRAVCIGINRYAAAPLNGCVKDANDWARGLSERGFEVTLLTDQQATRDGMLDALQKLIRAGQAGDTLVFQYSGHGTQLDDLDGDEAGGDTPGLDEALCPVDYDSGAFLIDDDIAAAVAELPEGVHLTFLLDCCHSGTGSRFAARAGPELLRGRNVRARFIPASSDMQAAHRRYRAQSAARSIATARAGATMREVTFAACQSQEVAYEVDGQGEFTRRALEILTTNVAPLTNAEFYERVLAAFGSGARQRPHLDCDVGARAARFLALEA